VKPERGLAELVAVEAEPAGAWLFSPRLLGRPLPTVRRFRQTAQRSGAPFAAWQQALWIFSPGTRCRIFLMLPGRLQRPFWDALEAAVERRRG
jgi:hypothetical protein